MVQSGSYILKLTGLTALIAASLLPAPAARADSFSYQEFRDRVFDLDKNFERMTGIQPVSCVFEGRRGQHAESSTGIGFCMWKNFFAALKDNESPGVIHAKIRPGFAADDSEPMSVDIYWRPVKSRVESAWWKKLLTLGIYAKVKQYQLIMSQYLENELVIESREGIPWRLLFGKLAGIQGFFGHEPDPKVRKIEIDLNPGPDKDDNLVGHVTAYEDPNGKPNIDFLLHSNFAIGKKGGIKWRLKGVVE